MKRKATKARPKAALKRRATARKPASGSKRPAATPKPSRAASDRSVTKRELESIITSLKRLGSARVRDDMQNRYGVKGRTADTAFGVGVGMIQKLGKSLGKNHALAEALWQWGGGQYEARMLASFVDDPALITAAQMDRWAKDFDNWGIVDTVCFKLFDQVAPELAFRKIEEWSMSDQEFVRRAGFVLLACMALHDKTTVDEPFLKSLKVVEKYAADDRNFVKKGASWALRSVGRRGPKLRDATITVAERFAKSDQPTLKWLGKDVIKDLTKAK